MSWLDRIFLAMFLVNAILACLGLIMANNCR